jgi:arylsulfatase A-like enzyme
MKTKKKNIIFIVMDSVRSRNLGCYGYHRKTSPNIDSLAKGGATFLKNFSTNNSTDNSVFSIFSGRHLVKREQHSKEINDNIFYSKEELGSFFNSGGKFLQEILKKNNYKTYCLKYLHGWQKRGFDYYFKEGSKKQEEKPKNMLDRLRAHKKTFNIIQKLYRFSSSKIITKYLAAKKINDRSKDPADEQATNKAIEIIKKNKGKENFFMWIDYVETHMPYYPGKFIGKFGNHPNAEKGVVASYDEAIFYDDYLIGKVINCLKKEKLFKNTIILFLSDHGESLGEHEIFFDHHGPYDVSFNVPLIISSKDLPVKRIDALTQLEDIAPTVLDLVGIGYDSNLFDGKSLVSLISGKEQKVKDSIFMEECYLERKIILRTEKYKYIEAKSKKEARCIKCNKVHGGMIELYNLEEDPEEKINLARKDNALLVKMKKKLDGKLKELKTTNEKRRLNQLISKI